MAIGHHSIWIRYEHKPNDSPRDKSCIATHSTGQVTHVYLRVYRLLGKLFQCLIKIKSLRTRIVQDLSDLMNLQVSDLVP